MVWQSEVDNPNQMSFTATHWDQTQGVWDKRIESTDIQTQQFSLCA